MGDPADSQRILASLLPPSAALRSGRASSRMKWAAAAGFMALALIGALYGVMQAQGAAHRTLAVAASGPPKVAPKAAPVVAPPVEPAQKPVQAARIESDPQASLPTNEPQVADPFQALGQASVEKPVVAAAAAVHGKPRAARGEPRTSAPGSSTKRHADSDVDLLEAVVAHVSGRPAATGAKSDGKATQKAARSSEGKAGKHDATPHQAPAGESVAELVQHCRAVGGLEGLLCRNRVCDGHWGSDAACPANRPPGPQEP
jgi:hypothetical protein